VSLAGSASGFQLPSPGEGPRQAGFSLLAHAFFDPERRPTVGVSVEIPYTSLIFLRKNGVYESDYAVYVKILDESKKLVETAVVTGSVVVADYEETRSVTRTTRASKQFQVAPGEYVVACSVEVKNTQRLFEKQVPVTVPVFLQAGIGVGKPRLFAADIDTSRVLPAMAQASAYDDLHGREKEKAVFADLDKHPLLVFEVYSEKEGSDSVGCELYFEVVDKQDVVHAYGRTGIRIVGLQNQFAVYLDVDEWAPGAYEFHVKAVQTDPFRQATSAFSFVLAYTRAMLTKDIDRTTAVLSLIGESEEVEEFKRAPESERGRLWEAFWARRDPTPGTAENEALEEHLRRVQFAIEHYSDAAPGWRSDRGKVYVKYGEPDHMEVKIEPQFEGEYLIWYYYKENRRFVFWDRSGLGDYRLTDTSQL
jgi:GWxTD domain-containing protein